MSVTHDEFRAALARFPSGVTVVTTRDSSLRFHGITVSAFCSVSLEPPMILVCIEKTTGSHRAINESGAFVVNILGESQTERSKHFASQISNKFDEIEYETGLTGLPVLTDAAAILECRLKFAYDAGDHTIFVGEVEKVRIGDVRPLVYFHGNYRAIKE